MHVPKKLYLREHLLSVYTFDERLFSFPEGLPVFPYISGAYLFSNIPSLSYG
jgi:hypothetical protein